MGGVLSFRVLPVFALLAVACAHLPKDAAAPSVTYVDRDTRWSGEVPVDGIVHVRKGATLTILPGTRVAFGTSTFGVRDEHEGFAGPGIRVEGRIVAEGTEESPIVFTSREGTPRPGSWDKILFTFSVGNRFRHCTFEGARYAFHAHFSGISVRECLFRDNEEGVRLGTSAVTIEESVFTRNAIRGINFRECRNEIRRNLVFGNGDGIFLHSRNRLSVIRENAVYANRGYNLRLGDLHAEDIDVSGNWWGTASEKEASETVYDGKRLDGIGTARIAPVLRLPPVAGATIGGVFMSHMLPVAGARVRAYPSVAGGLWLDGFAAETRTGENGSFSLAVPPGRYFVVGKADSAAGTLFAFPGRNPVTVGLRESAEIGLPSVLAPPRPVPAASPGSRPSIAVKATHSGEPAPGAVVQAFRPDAPDFRGPGDASAVTGDDGTCTLRLPPGEYFLVAKRRAAGSTLGVLEEGGLFGVYPYSPVRLSPGVSVSVEIPLFEKRGILADEQATARREGDVFEGSAAIGGKPAESYVVYFYRPAETIGKPLARSSPGSRDGSFAVLLPGPGEYLAYLRKTVPGLPAGTEEERIGPVPVRAEGGRLTPAPIPFRERGGSEER